MSETIIINEYKKSKLLKNSIYKNLGKKWSTNPNNWVIEIDNEKKQLLPYQKYMLKELYSVFYLAKIALTLTDLIKVEQYILIIMFNLKLLNIINYVQYFIVVNEVMKDFIM